MTVPMRKLELTDESATARFAEDLAAHALPGDLIALGGDLGTGKTTFARAFLRAFHDDPVLEVPSPTFTLVQAYEGGRFPVAHLDLYRLTDASEIDEIWTGDPTGDGLMLVEWPDRAEGRLAGARLNLTFAVDSDGRHAVTARAEGSWAFRLDRAFAIRDFLRAAGSPTAARRHMLGDMSARRYERVRPEAGEAAGKSSAVLMDWPRRDDEPTDEFYRRARRTQDAASFIAIGGALRDAGLSTPDILFADRDSGFLLLEDFGDRRVTAGDAPIAERYGATVDVLAHLHNEPRPHRLVAEGRPDWELKPFTADLMQIELTQFTDHYIPHVTDRPPDAAAREAFTAIWRDLLDRLGEAEESWVLLDVHSPNLLWLPERDGLRRVGLLDFQDALYGPTAYDAVSVMQDVRVTVPPNLEADLYRRYCAARGPKFDEDRFAIPYRILGAQRAMKVLGAFARLSTQQGRHGYLAHIPRSREYLARNLAHPVLSELALWYEQHMPQDDLAGS